jgi:hypothetical protein
VVVSSLVVQQQGRVTSLEDAINSGSRVCAYDQITEMLVAGRPRLAPLIIPRSLSQILSGMDNGDCDAAIMDNDGWNGIRLWGDQTHCGVKLRLAEPLATTAHAIPVRDDLALAVSWPISSAVERGRCATPSAQHNITRHGTWHNAHVHCPASLG